MTQDALAEHRAKEAYRLLQDATLLAALAQISKESMSALVTVDPDDKTDILRHQQRCLVVDEFLTMLERAVLAAPEVKEEATPYV